MRRLILLSGVFVGGVVALVPCRSARAQAILHPASPDLAPLAPGEASATFRFFMRRATGDTAERQVSRVTRGMHPAAPRVLLTTKWTPPFDTDDSLFVEPGSFAPVDERLMVRGVLRRFHYDGAHITGSIARPDSATRAFDRTFPEAPFAFNEVEVLVGSVPLRAGYSAVLPLFSEIDEAIEHDTVTVIGPGPAAPATWRVRFADPVLINIYTIDPSTRRVLASEVTQRQTGMRMRYERTEGRP